MGHSSQDGKEAKETSTLCFRGRMTPLKNISVRQNAALIV